MNARKVMVILTIMFFIASVTIGVAFAGDENDPEVDDETGDTVEQAEFRDIDAAWITEPNDNFTTISMKLAGPPPNLMDFASNIDTTTFEYEVYFDVGEDSYAVSATIQYAFILGGAYSSESTWNRELRQIEYELNSDIIQSETSLNETSGSGFDEQTAILTWTVRKENIGIASGFDGRGQEIVNTWAAVWNAEENPPGNPREPENAWDHAHTHYTDPGRSYRITGEGGADYNVILSVTESELETHGGTPVDFKVHARNDGSHPFIVDFDFHTENDYDKSWGVILSPNSSTIGVEITRTITVTVTPPKNVENGTEFLLVITGDIHEIDGNGTIPILEPVTLTTIGLATISSSDDNWWDIIMDNLAIILGVIAVVVVAIIVLLVLIRR